MTFEEFDKHHTTAWGFCMFLSRLGVHDSSSYDMAADIVRTIFEIGERGY